MKKMTFSFFTLILLVFSFQAASFSSPDIIMDSNLDNDWSKILVSKFRTLLKNLEIKDPFVGRIDGEVLLNESEFGNLLPKSSIEMIDTFGSALGLDILDGEMSISMTDFSYDVDGFKSHLNSADNFWSSLELDLDVSASEVKLEANKITLGLVIAGKKDSPVFNVEIINPRIIAKGNDLIKLFTRLKISESRNFYKFDITKANFNSMADQLLKNPDKVEINYDEIIVPEVGINIGNKRITIEPERVLKVIKKYHDGIKGVLLSQAAKLLKEDTEKSVVSAINKFTADKEYWIPIEDIVSKFSMDQILSRNQDNDLQVHFGGDFCLAEIFSRVKKECMNIQKAPLPPSRLSKKMYEISLSEISSLKYREGADFIASVSEDYLNKLLISTIDAGLWNSTLEQMSVDEKGKSVGKFELGPNKASLRLDKKGETGTLILDIQYTPQKWLHKLVLGKKVIRFPLVMDIGVRIENHQGNPAIIFRLHGADLSDETLINGIPDDNIVSNIKDRTFFKKTLANIIRAEVAERIDQDLFELVYPQYRNLSLEKVHFKSDGLGRMNAFFKFESFMPESEVEEAF